MIHEIYVRENGRPAPSIARDLTLIPITNIIQTTNTDPTVIHDVALAEGETVGIDAKIEAVATNESAREILLAMYHNRDRPL